MGPMKNYSCRSTERTIKSFTNEVRSTTHPGINCSNILTDRINMRQVGLQEALEAGNEEPVSSSRPIPNSVVSLPSDGPNSPQLWYPSGGEIELLDGEVMSGLEDVTLKRCLLSYYRRISPEHVLVTLDSSTIQLAGQV
ncbi:hypothetical protein G6F56_013756 [Rhizopus delemar]|nr:hypothetical protein G6F56_013756 [Rhizopus delemar]